MIESYIHARDNFLKPGGCADSSSFPARPQPLTGVQLIGCSM